MLCFKITVQKAKRPARINGPGRPNLLFNKLAYFGPSFFGASIAAAFGSGRLASFLGCATTAMLVSMFRVNDASVLLKYYSFCQGKKASYIVNSMP